MISLHKAHSRKGNWTAFPQKYPSKQLVKELSGEHSTSEPQWKWSWRIITQQADYLGMSLATSYAMTN